MARRLALVPLLAFTAAGCSFVPDFQRPEIEIPAQWSEQPAAAAVWPERGWWQAFGSPPLDRLIAEAEAGNADLGAAAARVLQAEVQTRVAGAPLFPSLSASTDVSHRRLGSGGTASTGTRTTSFSRDRNTTTYGAGLAASYELDLWGRNRAALASAEASALASVHDRRTVALTVVSDVASTWFQLLALRERLDLARRNLANAERVLQIVEARVANGAVSPLDLAQQRTVVANQRAAIPPLQSQVRQAETALAVLLGQPSQTFDAPAGRLTGVRTPEIRPGLPSELLARRPDIRAAEARLRAADADIGAARAAYFPAIQLTGDYGFQSAALSTLFDSGGSLLTLAAGLSQPIFQGGRLVAQEDVATARRTELVEVYRAAVFAAFADVENALAAARRTAEELALRAEAAASAQRALDLAEERYRAGAVDLLAVLDAQRSLFQAEEQLVQVRQARLQALVDLYRALGGGW